MSTTTEAAIEVPGHLVEILRCAIAQLVRSTAEAITAELGSMEEAAEWETLAGARERLEELFGWLDELQQSDFPERSAVVSAALLRSAGDQAISERRWQLVELAQSASDRDVADYANRTAELVDLHDGVTA